MTPEILNIIYIAGAAIGGFTLFCISIWGVYWKIATRRAKDLENIGNKISEVSKKLDKVEGEIYSKIENVKDELNDAITTKTTKVFKKVDDNHKEQSAQIFELAKETGENTGQLRRIK